MIKCTIEPKNATCGSEAFCKACGMDLDLTPIRKERKEHRGKSYTYCCENCAKLTCKV